MGIRRALGLTGVWGFGVLKLRIEALSLGIWAEALGFIGHGVFRVVCVYVSNSWYHAGVSGVGYNLNRKL